MCTWEGNVKGGEEKGRRGADKCVCVCVCVGEVVEGDVH